ncbi:MULTISPECIES: ABC transporter ATP-binding protein [unclassified Bartonella]|uniref:ABC transporter ATP-binding protein n=1 Tax=unclassified Bartonella TaxID=2645622 RepID=UPI00099912CD|nr:MULTISPECIES: ABC transporter ATP-binding protein [unclassified Bartonella]AQX28330.1 zinc/manganese transport system ATP-binding protein [Bartonella sp. JB15]AQX29599.1 zinc/manganese transport system ATP-binding protein [Bartonella sp. JB63]
MHLQFDNVTLGYTNKIVIKKFSAKLKKGSLIAIIGDNGSGKSTFLKTIAGLIKPISGKIKKPTRSCIAYLGQYCDIDRTFPIDIETILKMGLWSFCGLWKSQRSYQDKIQNALEIVGLTKLAHHPLVTLSSGQLQRALFARIIVQDSDIILLDEPFNGVDLKTKNDLLALITQWRQQGRTILIALHEPFIVQEYFPQTIHINKQHVFYGETKQLLSTNNHFITPLLIPNFFHINPQEQVFSVN